MKPTFKQFITESKNLHMTHAEDAILDGYDSGIQSVKYLKAVTEMLSGHANQTFNVTVKWDGSPAIICGINPENNKFFVGTKSVFNKKQPKINYTEEDIHNNHEGELADKLTIALQYLSKLDINGVVQGDLLFTHDSLSTKTIDGAKYVTFRPNTITYAVPVDTPLAKQIQSAKLGIVFHTKYSGKSFFEMTSSFDVDHTRWKKIKDVWVESAVFRDETGTATLTKHETDEVMIHLKSAETILKTINKQQWNRFISNNSTIIAAISQHLNAKIRVGEHITDPSKHVDEVLGFLHGRVESEKQKLKTERAKENKEQAKIIHHSTINANRSLLTSIFQFQVHLNEAKVLLIRKLEHAKRFGHFIEIEKGLVSTQPEGFVAVDHLTNNALKLVDRLTFSKANFNIAKQWKRE